LVSIGAGYALVDSLLASPVDPGAGYALAVGLASGMGGGFVAIAWFVVTVGAIGGMLGVVALLVCDGIRVGAGVHAEKMRITAGIIRNNFCLFMVLSL
jgi:hypothetical protein